MIAVFGEALMDVFDAGPTAQGLALDARVGGSPFNVAIGLARLGQPVAFCGTLSRDFMGTRLLQALLDEGVQVGAVQRVDAPSAMCLVSSDTHGVPSYRFFGQGSADRLITAARVQSLPPGTRVLQLGSYTLVVEPAASALAGLLRRWHPQGLVAMDPNVRTVVEPDLERWRAMLMAHTPHVHLLKLSTEDAEQLYPGQPLAVLARRWLEAGVVLVVFTQGGEGACAWHRNGLSVQVPPTPVAVVDTVGAGDTFQAALLARLAEQGRLSAEGLAALDEPGLHDLLRFASRAAAVTCGRRGADMPRRADLDQA
jgi:fructokinase